MKMNSLSRVSLCALCALCGESSAQSLEERIKPLAEKHAGKVAVAVKHLGTGETYFLNADETMPTASLVKLPVMVEAYWQAHEGKVKLGQITAPALAANPRRTT